MGFFQVARAEVRPLKVSLYKESPFQMGTREICLFQMDTNEVGVTEISLTNIEACRF